MNQKEYSKVLHDEIQILEAIKHRLNKLDGEFDIAIEALNKWEMVAMGDLMDKDQCKLHGAINHVEDAIEKLENMI